MPKVPGIHRSEESWKRSKAWLWAGSIVWAAPMLVICALILHGEKAGRTVHLVYGSALRNWSECADLYNVRVNTDASTGQTVVEASLAFLYPPSFLVLYKPFTWFPAPWGELAWRVLAAAALAWLLRMLIRRQPRRSANLDFALLSMAVVPVCLGALQMGQANAVLAACLLAACLAIGSGRANLAGTWLALGIAIKPILLAPAALAIVLLPSCLPPLLVVLGLLLASPFLTAPTAYVLKQYGLFLQQTFGPCLNVSEDRFADLNGLLRGMGLEMRAPFSTVVRAGVGLSMAAWMLRARRRLGRVDAALLWLAVSSAYLMLFNPMTEANSYCMLSVPMALCAWRWIDAGRRWVGWSLLASVPAMGVCSELIRPISRHVGGQFDLRFMPIMALLFLVAMVARFPPRSSPPALEASPRPAR